MATASKTNGVDMSDRVPGSVGNIVTAMQHEVIDGYNTGHVIPAWQRINSPELQEIETKLMLAIKDMHDIVVLRVESPDIKKFGLAFSIQLIDKDLEYEGVVSELQGKGVALELYVPDQHQKSRKLLVYPWSGYIKSPAEAVADVSEKTGAKELIPLYDHPRTTRVRQHEETVEESKISSENGDLGSENDDGDEDPIAETVANDDDNEPNEQEDARIDPVQDEDGDNGSPADVENDVSDSIPRDAEPEILPEPEDVGSNTDQKKVKREELSSFEENLLERTENIIKVLGFTIKEKNVVGGKDLAIYLVRFAKKSANLVFFIKVMNSCGIELSFQRLDGDDNLVQITVERPEPPIENILLDVAKNLKKELGIDGKEVSEVSDALAQAIAEATRDYMDNV